MKGKWQVNWIRVAVGTLICFAALWLVAWASTPLIAWHFAQETIRDNPHLNLVPMPVQDRSVVALDGLQIKHFEYSLQIPWKDVDVERDAKMVFVLHFKRGVALMLFAPSTAVDTVKLIRGKNEEDTKAVTRLLGARALSSNYDLMAAELAATPAMVRWWATPTENARCITLLNLKSVEMHESNAIYMQSSEEMHGFQFGNPAVAPYRVELDLFDRNDRRYQILIAGKDLTRQALTQAEINAMVASLRPIPHS